MVSASVSKPACLSLASLYLNKITILIKKQSNFKIIFVFKRTKHIWFFELYNACTYHEDQEGTPSLDKLVRSCFPKRQLPYAGRYQDRPWEGTDLLLHVYDYCLWNPPSSKAALTWKRIYLWLTSVYYDLKSKVILHKLDYI